MIVVINKNEGRGSAEQGRLNDRLPWLAETVFHQGEDGRYILLKDRVGETGNKDEGCMKGRYKRRKTYSYDELVALLLKMKETELCN